MNTGISNLKLLKRNYKHFLACKFKDCIKCKWVETILVKLSDNDYNLVIASVSTEDIMKTNDKLLCINIKANNSKDYCITHKQLTEKCNISKKHEITAEGKKS